MSKLNLVILTLCVTGVVIILFVFPFYVSVSIILPVVLCFLYIDYKNQQSTIAGREHSHAGGLPSYTDIRDSFGSFWANISLSMQKYYIGIVNQSSGNTDVSVPSHSRSQLNHISRKFNPSGTSVRSITNLDENRPSSTSFYRPNGNYTFDGGLSPIRLTDSPSPASDFRNLRISDRPRPMESSLSMRTRNQSCTPIKNLLGDPCYSRKHQNGRGSPKNIQSIAGPLLASTRYNLSLDSAAYADVTSAGLTSRLVKYATDHPATHQQQYSGPGQFPTIQLARNSRLPVVTRSQVVGRSPVRIRIAPPEFLDRRNYISPDPTHLHISSGGPSSRSSLERLQEISRPDRLQDGPRKRLHAQLGETEDEAAKKQRVSDCSRTLAEDAATSKRGREESPKDDSQTKRTRNNEISSSLSSSRHLTAGTNKRKQSLDEWSQSGTTMPAGKQAKKSTPSLDTTPSNSTDQVGTPLPSQHMEIEATPLTSKTSPPTVDESPAAVRLGPTSRSEERSAAPTRMSPAPMKGLLYPPSRDVSGWVTADTYPESENTFAVEKAKLAGEDLKNQRELDAKRRLSSMMFIVGDKEESAQKDFTATSSFASVSTPSLSFAASTPTPILSTAKATPPPYQETSTPKSSDKHVHFADKLTEVKTFSPTWPDASNSGGATSQPLTGLFATGNSQQGVGSEAKTNVSGKTQEQTISPSLFAFGTAQAQSSDLKTGENTTVKFGTESSKVVPNFGTADENKKNEVDSSTTPSTLKPSVGFSFGSNPTLPSFPVVKSSSVTDTLAPTSVASGQNINSSSLFGQVTPGKSSLDLSASNQQAGQPSTTFSQSAPISSATFKQTASNSPVMFGMKNTDSVANLGAPTTTSNAALSFGQTTTLTSAQNSSFGAVAASNKPTFGSISPATFGGSAQPISVLSELGSINASKEKVAPSPSFGSPATTTGFSMPVLSAGGFGTPALSTSSGFSTPSTVSSSSFGMPSIVPSSGGFGSPSIVSTSSGFGTPSAVSASSGFGTPSVVSASSGFGTPSVVSASSGFGTPSVTSASSGFGPPTTVSAGGGFGSPAVTNKQAPTTGLFGFGAATTAQGQSVGFGSQANPVQSGFGGFGGSTTQTTSAFGGKPTTQSGFSFGGSSATQASSANTSVFGAKTEKQMATPNFSLGNQNAATNLQQTANTGNAQPFKIDFSGTSKPSSGFGGMSSANPMMSGNSFADANKQATNPTQNTFQFGASSAKPFSFGGSAGNENAAPNSLFGSASSNAVPPNTTQNNTNVFGQGVFGSQIQQPISTTANAPQQKPSSMFSFGGGNAAAQQTANSFAFGANASSARPGGFAFGGAPAQAPQSKPAGGFAFGGSSTPQSTQGNPFGQASQPQPASSAQAFQFGSAAPASSGFNFGSVASNSPAPAFGAGAANNAFQMGSAAQQQQQQQQQQSQGQGMFSIGSGSAAPRARSARLVRRQR